MNESPRPRNFARGALYSVIAIIWIVLGIALSLMCIKVFGDNTAEIGVPALVVVVGLIWYFTERRDRNKQEENA